jgi:hypothetical protein
MDEVHLALQAELKRQFPIYSFSCPDDLDEPYIHMMKAGRGNRPVSVLTIQIIGDKAEVSWTPPPMRALKIEWIDLANPKSIDDLVTLIGLIITQSIR